MHSILIPPNTRRKTPQIRVYYASMPKGMPRKKTVQLNSAKPLILLVGARGFEPPTTCTPYWFANRTYLTVLYSLYTPLPRLK